jgi:hypothetical protein
MVARDVSSYSKMLMDPFARNHLCRYPDETIVPTALVHLTTSVTYTVPTGTSDVRSVLRWKVTDLSVTSAFTYTQPAPVAGASVAADYGTPQAAWSALNAVDRTLGCGIRMRVVGLPTSTFLPSGTAYFLQLQQDEGFGITTEAQAIQAVTAGKGFSMTINELSKLDGVNLTFLPQGPMSFVFSDRNSTPAAQAGFTPSVAAGILSANPNLYVVSFGVQEGLVLRFDYAHAIEYIPGYTAAGVVASQVESPSAAAREGIAKATAMIQDHRSGSTSGSEVASIVNPGALMGSLASQIGKAAVGMIPGGSAFVAGASQLSKGLGAPPWLTSALSSLM